MRTDREAGPCRPHSGFRSLRAMGHYRRRLSKVTYLKMYNIKKVWKEARDARRPTKCFLQQLK